MTRHLRGDTICRNALEVRLADAEDAVLVAVERDVLNVAVLETSLYKAITARQAPTGHEDRSVELREEGRARAEADSMSPARLRAMPVGPMRCDTRGMPRQSPPPPSASDLLSPQSSDRVTYEVEQQFLELDDLRADATASLPPSVWVEWGVPRGSNRDSRLVTLQGALKHST